MHITTTLAKLRFVFLVKLVLLFSIYLSFVLYLFFCGSNSQFFMKETSLRSLTNKYKQRSWLLLRRASWSAGLAKVKPRNSKVSAWSMIFSCSIQPSTDSWTGQSSQYFYLELSECFSLSHKPAAVDAVYSRFFHFTLSA